MKKLLLMLAAALTVSLASAQESTEKPLLNKAQWLSARLDLYHQDYLGDILKIGQLGTYDRVHIRPGFRVGVECGWVRKKHFRLYQAFLAGYHHNTYDERSWTVGTEIGFEWRIFKQFRVALPIGIHYNNAKAIDIRYEYVGDHWVKAKNTDASVHRLQVTPLSLNIGWRFNGGSMHYVDVFANGNLSAIGPWQPGVGVPVLFYKAAGIGMRVGL